MDGKENLDLSEWLPACMTRQSKQDWQQMQPPRNAFAACARLRTPSTAENADSYYSRLAQPVEHRARQRFRRKFFHFDA